MSITTDILAAPGMADDPATTEPAEAEHQQELEGTPAEATTQASPEALFEIPTIAVATLTANPNNVRESLRVDRAFVASIKAEGVRVPLLLTPAGEGGYLIVDGNRRLVGAQEAGLERVPYVLDRARAADLAGQYLDQVITSRHRESLRPFEESDALFAAQQAGASKTRIQKAYGSREGANTALRIAKIPAEVRAAALRDDYPWTIDELAGLAEFAEDEQATGRLISAAADNTFTWRLERERVDRDETKAREDKRAELLAAGVKVADERPEGATLLWKLDDATGEKLTEDTHAACSGHIAVIDPYSAPPEVTHYCADSEGNGHTNRTARLSAPGSDAPLTPDPEAIAAQARAEAEATAKRRAVKEGNKDWRAARTVRREWLSSLLARKSLTKAEAQQIGRYVAESLLTMPHAISAGTTGMKVTKLQAEFLGIAESAAASREAVAAAANPNRCWLLALARVAASHENAIEENTWRIEQYDYNGVRREGGAWLSWLAAMGYQPSPIEAAVMDGREYEPEQAAPGAAPIPEGDPGDDSSPDVDPEDADQTEGDPDDDDPDRSEPEDGPDEGAPSDRGGDDPGQVEADPSGNAPEDDDRHAADESSTG